MGYKLHMQSVCRRKFTQLRLGCVCIISLSELSFYLYPYNASLFFSLSLSSHPCLDNKEEACNHIICASPLKRGFLLSYKYNKDATCNYTACVSSENGFFLSIEEYCSPDVAWIPWDRILSCNNYLEKVLS